MPRQFPDVFVLRHGETEWNAQRRMQGRLNSPLTALGRDHAAQQRELLAGLDLAGHAYWTSPQLRSVETAAIALPGLAVAVRSDDRLMEIDVGDWNGRFLADLRVSHPGAFDPDNDLAWYDRAPGGEGFSGLEARCRSFLADLRGPAVIFCHGITSRMLRCLVMGMPPEAIGELPGGQGVIHTVRDGVHETISGAR